MPLVDSAVCRQEDVYGAAIMDGMTCAGFWQEGSDDACDGDSGGPLVCSEEDGINYVYGLISWGHKCGTTGKPGVYVKVAHYLQWIEDKLKVLQNRIGEGIKH